jgi:alpha-amylase
MKIQNNWIKKTFSWLSELCFIAPLLGILILAGPVAAAENVPRTVFVHLFEWRWDDIAKECENFLGHRGFAAVQVSPPNEHRLVKLGGNKGYPWWERYQPVSYKLESRSGNEQQFKDMVTRCKAAGVKIYADAVINHMTGPKSDNDSQFGKGTGDSSYAYYAYPPYPNDSFFHSCHTKINNYNNRGGGAKL